MVLAGIHPERALSQNVTMYGVLTKLECLTEAQGKYSALANIK